jgi:hypothetical protein
MRETQVHQGGMYSAAGLSMFGTIGYFVSSAQMVANWNWLWIALFAVSLMLLSGAVVNFDPKRIVK